MYDCLFLFVAFDATNARPDLKMGAIYIPTLGGTGNSMDTMAVVPVASALLGPVVGLASAKAVLSHFRYEPTQNLPSFD